MKFKVVELDRNKLRILGEFLFSIAKHRGSQMRGSKMLVIRLFQTGFGNLNGHGVQSQVKLSCYGV